MSPTPSSGPTPAVSRVMPDGTIVELIYDADAHTTAFAVMEADQAPCVLPVFDLPDGGRLTPYSPGNNLIASGCVLLPSAVGDVGDKRDLLDVIRAYLDRYVDLTPTFREVAAHYVLLSWVYDAFRELPMLRVRGDYGTGKTRALLTIGSLCYKPFFASGASTVSPIFHILDAFRGTLILDEADFRFSDATAELTKVLNNGTVDGLPILRTMANRHRELNPQAFRVFGPKLIAMRQSFDDDALESRFITEETGSRPLPPHIPIHMPNTLAKEAQQLRNRLLGWRFQERMRVQTDPTRLMEGAEPRLNQTALALLSLVDDAALRSQIAAFLRGGYDTLTAERGDRLETVMLEVIVDLFAGAPALGVAVSDITARFNERVSHEMGKPMSPRWVGSFLRGRLHLRTAKSGGVYRVPREERRRIEALATRAGLSINPPLDFLDQNFIAA